MSDCTTNWCFEHPEIDAIVANEASLICKALSDKLGSKLPLCDVCIVDEMGILLRWRKGGKLVAPEIHSDHVEWFFNNYRTDEIWLEKVEIGSPIPLFVMEKLREMFA